MGSWLAKELSGKHEIAVYSRTFEKAQKVASALKNAIAMRDLNELENFKPELLINAVSLQNTLEAFESALPHIPKECAIADVASIKTGIQEYYSKCGHSFVSVHPMFGPTFANVEALENENAVIITESDPRLKEFFRKFFARLKLNLFEYTFREHDEMMAVVLGLSHFIAIVAADTLLNSDRMPRMAGTSGITYRVLLTLIESVLSEDPALYASLQMNLPGVSQLEQIFQGKAQEWADLVRNKEQAKFAGRMQELKEKLAKESPDFGKAYENMYRIAEGL